MLQAHALPLEDCENLRFPLVLTSWGVRGNIGIDKVSM